LQRWQLALENAETWAADLATGPARRRLLQLMRKLGEHADDEGRIWLPRRDEIGAMLDMTVETASRLVSRLRREGVIELLAPRAARLDDKALREALRQQDAI
jgi:CRP/FNR family transcriptional regulator, anaerobic regulatory protein